MNEKLREYIDSVFEDAPNTRKAVELKEEILQNLLDRYDDQLTQGKSEEAAFNIAVAGIGDLTELIYDLKRSGGFYRQDGPQEQQERKQSALITASAVMLYIFGIIPLILLGDKIGLISFLALCAAATGLLIYNSMTRSRRQAEYDSMADEFMDWRGKTSDQKRLFNAINSALWSVTVVAYIIISFLTNAWHITWVIFLLSVAASNILKAVMELRR